MTLAWLRVVTAVTATAAAVRVVNAPAYSIPSDASKQLVEILPSVDWRSRAHQLGTDRCTGQHYYEGGEGKTEGAMKRPWRKSTTGRSAVRVKESDGASRRRNRMEGGISLSRVPPSGFWLSVDRGKLDYGDGGNPMGKTAA